MTQDSATATLDLPATANKKFRRLPAWRLLRGLRQMNRGNFTGILAHSQIMGDAFATQAGPVRIIHLNDPDLVETLLVKNHKSYKKDPSYAALRRFLGNGLLTSEADFHLRQRRMIQPAFHKKRVDAYAECMVQYAREQMSKWHDGQALDIHAEMMAVTLSIIAKTMFNADVSHDIEVVGHALDVGFKYFGRYMVPAFGRFMDALPLSSTRQIAESGKMLDDIIFRMIDEHRAAKEDWGDLLSMLLQVQYEDDGSGMSNQQLRDECLTLFLAGHETTAVALSWTWYLLSQHPGIEAKLHEELDRVLHGRDATANDVELLPYTRQVFAESMRLFPPAYGFGRQAVEDNVLGPYRIRKRDVVLVSQYVMHRLPQYFPDPEKFDPERWTPDRAATLPKFAYFPFGGGSRKCIGESFAWMEGILLLATFAQRWQFRLKPGHEIGLEPVVTLRPRGGMPMSLHRRVEPAAPRESEGQA